MGGVTFYGVNKVYVYISNFATLLHYRAIAYI